MTVAKRIVGRVVMRAPVMALERVEWMAVAKAASLAV